VRRPLRRALLAASAGVLVVGSFAGSARADVTPAPTPADTSPSAVPTPSPTDGVPAASPTAPTPSPTNPSARVPEVPIPLAPGQRTPVPSPTSGTPGPSTSSSTPPTTDPALPPNDGVVPTSGEIDQYFALTAQRDVLASRLTPLAAALATAKSTVTWYESERPTVALQLAQAEAASMAAQQSTDDVIRDLYIQGDAGFGAYASLIGSGPSNFIDRLDNLRYARNASNGVVLAAYAAQTQVDLAQATLQSYDVHIKQARAGVLQAQAALDQALADLGALDSQLVTFAISPPQVAVGPDGCPTVNVQGTLRDGAESIGAPTLCSKAVKQAATPQAALAITWAFQHLGAAYACGGAGRMLPFRADCSSFVSRAYHEGAGLGTAGDAWAPSTRDMVPWDGAALDPHYAYVPPLALRPGDLVLYNTCPQGGCPYRHVVMYLGSPDGGKTFWMVHTNSCGDVAHVSKFLGFPTSGEPFLVARRVVPVPGEVVRVPTPAVARAAAAASARAAVASVRAARFG